MNMRMIKRTKADSTLPIVNLVSASLARSIILKHIRAQMNGKEQTHKTSSHPIIALDLPMVHHQAPLADCHMEILWVSDTKIKNKNYQHKLQNMKISGESSIACQASKHENIIVNIASSPSMSSIGIRRGYTWQGYMQN